MTGHLEHTSALITAAARGISLEFAKSYLSEGARVCIEDIDIDRACCEVEKLGERAFAIPLYVCDQHSINTAVNQVISRIGQIDILVNNAAVFSTAPIVDIERSDFQTLIDVNVFGPLFIMQTVAKHMIKNKVKGKIINMASQAGRRGEPVVAVYCATKAAVINLMQSAGLNLIKHGINVNAIAPGVVDGEHWDGIDAYFAKLENKEPGQKKKEVGKNVPFGRMGTGNDLTGIAIFLAREEANYIVAQCYNIDGGQWIS